MAAFLPVIHAARTDRPDEIDTLAMARAVAAALERLGYRSPVIALGLDFSGLGKIAAEQPVAVFNLVEAVEGDAALAPIAAMLLEHFGLPFTGAPAAAWRDTLSKITVKQRLRAAGLPTPPWWEAGGAVPPGATVIVKAVTEHASFGMDPGSVVSGRAAATEIAARTRRFGTRFFAEVFLPGREFNLALYGPADAPDVLPIQEIVFADLAPGSARIVDYAAKWDESSPACRGTRRRFGIEEREPGLARRLRELALAVWKEFGLAGYARVDVRTDAAGVPFILEVNVNPCLSPDAGFVAAAAEAGLEYDALIARIVAIAIEQGSERRCCAS